MIHLPDSGIDAGTASNLREFQQEVDAAGAYAAQVAEAKTSFARRNRQDNATFRKVREGLARMCAGARRCVYCEDSAADEVEHIQPKELYPGKVFVWPNYVYACGICNRAKGSKFSVVNGGRLVDVTRRRSDPVVPPTPGSSAFLNPRLEEPLEYLHLDLATFVLVARDDCERIDQERADFTIETLKLNRDVLIKARSTAYRSYRSGLFEYAERRTHAGHDELAPLEIHLITMPPPHGLGGNEASTCIQCGPCGAILSRAGVLAVVKAHVGFRTTALARAGPLGLSTMKRAE